MPQQLSEDALELLHRPLTPQECSALQNAVRIVLDCYETALQDPKVVIGTPLHAAMFRLKQVMETK